MSKDFVFLVKHQKCVILAIRYIQLKNIINLVLICIFVKWPAVVTDLPVYVFSDVMEARRG